MRTMTDKNRNLETVKTLMPALSGAPFFPTAAVGFLRCEKIRTRTSQHYCKKGRCNRRFDACHARRGKSPSSPQKNSKRILAVNNDGRRRGPCGGRRWQRRRVAAMPDARHEATIEPNSATSLFLSPPKQAFAALHAPAAFRSRQYARVIPLAVTPRCPRTAGEAAAALCSGILPHSCFAFALFISLSPFLHLSSPLPLIPSFPLPRLFHYFSSFLFSTNSPLSIFFFLSLL